MTATSAKPRVHLPKSSRPRNGFRAWRNRGLGVPRAYRPRHARMPSRQLARSFSGPMQRSVLMATALTSIAAFVVLSFLVADGMTQSLDEAARGFFRPNDVWGVNQEVFGHFVDALAPPITSSLVLVAGGLSAWRLRRLRPLVFAGLFVSSAALLTILTKAALERPDPHGHLSGLAGAYPSGHIVMLLVSLGCALLVLRARAWWMWIGLALLGLLLAVSLLFLAMHWLTDVVGGALLGITMLALLISRRVDPTIPEGNVKSSRLEGQGA